MIFKVNKKTSEIKVYSSSWVPKELEVEKYILPEKKSDEHILNPEVFKEDLLLVKNQARTGRGKRADILALDKAGNAVIIELKKDTGQLGVETQALQYLAAFSSYQGKNFIRHFAKYSKTLEDDIQGFLGDNNVQLEDINKNSRIILMAQKFDRSLYSMGIWLASCNVAFRCVEYTPFEVNGEYFLSFSIAFDQSPLNIYPLSFQRELRDPQYFWHNIGKNHQQWWEYLVQKGQISTGFSNEPNDEGERILKNYIKGDTILAYATKYGAVGWGVIEKPEYKLLSAGSEEDKLGGVHLHRLKIRWKNVVRNLGDGLSASFVRNEFSIYHPVSTSVSIDDEKAKRLIAEMKKVFQQAG
jgi:hypothetical protein